LVNAAKFFGYNFKGRDEDNNIIVELKNTQDDLIVGENARRMYQLLNVIEFNSTRKRMSVIVRSRQDDSIRVMCKGADSIIIPLLKKGQDKDIKKTSEFLDSFSKEGLRTLVIAEKYISPEEYSAWNKEYQRALVETKDREEKVMAVSEQIERGFTLVGTTAIEDKL